MILTKYEWIKITWKVIIIILMMMMIIINLFIFHSPFRHLRFIDNVANHE